MNLSEYLQHFLHHSLHVPAPGAVFHQMNNLYRPSNTHCLISSSGLGPLSLWELSGLPLNKSGPNVWCLSGHFYSSLTVWRWHGGNGLLEEQDQGKNVAGNNACLRDWWMQRSHPIYIPLIPNWFSLGKMVLLKKRERVQEKRDGGRLQRGASVNGLKKLPKWKSILCLRQKINQQFFSHVQFNKFQKMLENIVLLYNMFY